MTTYDTIWTTFLNNVLVSDIELPQTAPQIYEAIKNGVLHYNNRMQSSIICNDDEETLNIDLNDSQLLILAHYIRLVFLKNKLTLFVLTWQPFEKDIGIKNFSYQLRGLEALVSDEINTIESLIRNQEEDFL